MFGEIFLKSGWFRAGQNQRRPGRRAVGIACLVAAGLALSACSQASSLASATASAQEDTRQPGGELTPYPSATSTATITPTNTAIPTATPQPSPTATPRTHTVKKGEDLAGIALRYGVELAELLAANPKVNPHYLSIGTQLIIPESTTPAPPNIDQPAADTTPQPGGAQGQPTPTAIPVELGNMHCARAQDGGVWCFQVVKNGLPYPLEGVAATFYLAGGDNPGAKEIAQSAFLPLDVLPANGSLPLSAYFPPETARQIAEPFQFRSQVQSALRSADDGRYLRSHVENLKAAISTDGLSAEISLDLLLDQPDSQAKRAWLAATAYDAAGNVVGIRRWEYTEANPIATGQRLAVRLNVYSISGEISRVEAVGEIRP